MPGGLARALHLQCEHFLRCFGRSFVQVLQECTNGWTPLFLPHWHDIGNLLPIQPGKYRGEQFLDIRAGDVMDVVASRNGVEEFEEQHSTAECPRVIPELLLRYPAADATIRFQRRVQPKHQLFGEALLRLWRSRLSTSWSVLLSDCS